MDFDRLSRRLQALENKNNVGYANVAGAAIMLEHAGTQISISPDGKAACNDNFEAYNLSADNEERLCAVEEAVADLEIAGSTHVDSEQYNLDMEGIVEELNKKADKEELNEKADKEDLNIKADIEHTHNIEEVEELAEILDTKADIEDLDIKADIEHTHTLEDIDQLPVVLNEIDTSLSNFEEAIEITEDAIVPYKDIVINDRRIKHVLGESDYVQDGVVYTTTENEGEETVHLMTLEYWNAHRWELKGDKGDTGAAGEDGEDGEYGAEGGDSMGLWDWFSLAFDIIGLYGDFKDLAELFTLFKTKSLGAWNLVKGLFASKKGLGTLTTTLLGAPIVARGSTKINNETDLVNWIKSRFPYFTGLVGYFNTQDLAGIELRSGEDGIGDYLFGLIGSAYEHVRERITDHPYNLDYTIGDDTTAEGFRINDWDDNEPGFNQLIVLNDYSCHITWAGIRDSETITEVNVWFDDTPQEINIKKGYIEYEDDFTTKNIRIDIKYTKEVEETQTIINEEGGEETTTITKTVNCEDVIEVNIIRTPKAEALLTADVLQQLLDLRATKNHTHTQYALKTDLDNIVFDGSNYAPLNHTHNEYALVNHTHSEYAEKEHTHFIRDINMLQEELDRKAAEDHTHDITLTVNMGDIHHTLKCEHITDIADKYSPLEHTHSNFESLSIDRNEGDRIVMSTSKILIVDKYGLEAVEIRKSGITYNQEPYLTKSQLIDLFYPVGSIYTSMNSTDPSEKFGGTWTQITDRFLYCANSSKVEGGSAKITEENLPSHNHTVNITSGSAG